MRRGQYTVSGKDVARLAVGWLVQALGWTTRSGKVSPEVLIQLLVRAAAEMRSLWAIVHEAGVVPSFETVRKALMRSLPNEPEALLPQTTKALHSRLPKSLLRRPQDMAVDLHLRPYYGKSKTGVVGGKRKASTKKFFAYATLMVVRRGQKFTVGYTHVRAREEQTAILSRLLEQAQQAGLRVRYLLLDRGFYAARTIQWLQEQKLAFVMPMLRRGKSGPTKRDSTGTACFFVRGRRGWSRHTWKAYPRRDGKKQKSLTVSVEVCMAPRQPGNHKKNKKGPLVFACHGIRRSPAEIVALYRKRFRIETSYRQLREVLVFTCSNNWVYRVLLVAIALMLRNLWVWLHWLVLRERTPAGRQVCLERLRFRKLTYWLMRVLDKKVDIQLQVITT